MVLVTKEFRDKAIQQLPEIQKKLEKNEKFIAMTNTPAFLSSVRMSAQDRVNINRAVSAIQNSNQGYRDQIKDYSYVKTLQTAEEAEAQRKKEYEEEKRIIEKARKMWEHKIPYGLVKGKPEYKYLKQYWEQGGNYDSYTGRKMLDDMMRRAEQEKEVVSITTVQPDGKGISSQVIEENPIPRVKPLPKIQPIPKDYTTEEYQLNEKEKPDLIQQKENDVYSRFASNYVQNKRNTPQSVNTGHTDKYIAFRKYANYIRKKRAIEEVRQRVERAVRQTRTPTKITRKAVRNNTSLFWSSPKKAKKANTNLFFRKGRSKLW